MTPLPSLFDLRGRTAFITGSTRGLGWSSACCLAELGDMPFDDAPPMDDDAPF